MSYNAATLTASPIQPKLDPAVDYEAVRFVGRSPDGHVVVATTTGSGSWDVLHLSPNNLEEDNQLHQNFPLSVSNIEIDAGGLGQIWVDGGTLYYLGPASSKHGRSATASSRRGSSSQADHTTPHPFAALTTRIELRCSAVGYNHAIADGPDYPELPARRGFASCLALGEFPRGLMVLSGFTGPTKT